MKATLEMAHIPPIATNTDPSQFRITLTAEGCSEECREFYEQLLKLLRGLPE